MLENDGRVPEHRAASSSLCISTYFKFNNSIELHLKFTWKISEKHQLFLRDIIFLCSHSLKDPSCWDSCRVLRQVLPCCALFPEHSYRQSVCCLARFLHSWCPCLPTFEHPIEKLKRHLRMDLRSWHYSLLMQARPVSSAALSQL